MEYRKELETEDKSAKITLEVKAEHLTDDEKRKILGFIFPEAGGRVTINVKYESISALKAEKMAAVTEEFLDRLTEVIQEGPNSEDVTEYSIEELREEILKHFGVSSEEADEAELFICKNDDFFREKTGIALNLRSCKAAREKKKVRIIVDYDADFPRI